jgi:rhodanese-related sulfurtransferase
MPLDASQFVLPGFGGNPGDNLNRLSQQLWMRNVQTQRLQLAQEQKREEAGNFLAKYLNPKDYLNGSEYDPVVNIKLQHAMEHGSQLAAQGADIPTILQGIGPEVRDLSTYTAAAKTIDQQVKDGVSQMKEQGVKGVDFEKAAYRAKALAFHATDPKTGEDIGLKNPQDVDVSQNYLQRAIQEHPEEVTNASGVEAYAKTLPSQKVNRNLIQSDAYGNTVTNNVHTTAPEGFVPDVDAKGRTTGMVPPYEIATDQGKPLMHTFAGPDGKPTQAPVRMLDENYFDQMLKSDPYIAQHYIGQAKQHWAETEAGKPFDPSSPDAKRLARTYAYDDLKQHTPTSIELAQANKESGAEVQLHVWGSREQQAYDKTLGAGEAKEDLGTVPGKANTVDTMIQIAKNNPDFLHGKPAEVNGKAVLDVSSQLPKAQLKYGPGKLDAYTNVYYDPKEQTYILQNNRNPKNPTTETVTPQQLPDLLHRIAQPNSVPGGSPTATKSLTKYGYNNGKFGDVGDAPDLAGSLAAEKASSVTQGLDAWQKGGEKTVENNGIPAALKGVRTPDGTVTGIKTKWFGDKYQLSLKDDKGKETTQRFPTREAMEAYLNTSTLKSAQPAAAAPKAPSNLTPDEQKILREQGLLK